MKETASYICKQKCSQRAGVWHKKSNRLIFSDKKENKKKSCQYRKILSCKCNLSCVIIDTQRRSIKFQIRWHFSSLSEKRFFIKLKNVLRQTFSRPVFEKKIKLITPRSMAASSVGQWLLWMGRRWFIFVICQQCFSSLNVTTPRCNVDRFSSCSPNLAKLWPVFLSAT